MSFHVPESARVLTGPLKSTPGHGNNGAFVLDHGGLTLHMIASAGAGWEHVSVSLRDRCPTWEEMCFVKDLFWDDDNTVIQYHPSKRHYVNHHPYCLHLWRPIHDLFPIPHHLLVGPKSSN